MSWLFGYYGKLATSNIKSPETPLYSFKSPNLILFSGGNKQTTLFKSYSSDNCWAVVGVGLKILDDECILLKENDWNNILDSPQIEFSAVNGHFVAIKYSDNELKFFTDDLGLREIHIVKTVDGYGFSTRIDWLKYFIKPEINLKEFGSRWLLQNQISRKSIIKGVHRLVSSSAVIQNNELNVKEHMWQPDFDLEFSKKKFDHILISLLTFKDKKISLSLSGGLDSRLLLSYLFNKNPENWGTHTFGDPNHPDSKIASELLYSVGRKNEIIDGELLSTDKLIELLKSYSVQTIVTNPISSILNLRFYNRLKDENRIIIDGGFGEIWRRAFANRLLLLGKNHLVNKDALAVSKFLRFNRADIFSDEALNEMEIGVVDQLNFLFKEMPDADLFGPAKWIDLFSIRSRLINYYAPEQARIDNYVVSFMPLAQKEIIALLFGLKDSEKKNGKLFKQLIGLNSIQLTKLPLVKGNVIYPFNTPSLISRVYSKLKLNAGLHYQDSRADEFFFLVKDFILELIHSFEVQNCELFDKNKINKIESKLLSSGHKYNKEVDWFLSFELFRQGLSR